MDSNRMINLGSGGGTAASFVGFRAYASSGQTISTTGNWHAITVDTEVFDEGSNFASNEFTVPTTGYYMLGGRTAMRSSNIRVLPSLWVDTGSGYAEHTYGNYAYDTDNFNELGLGVTALLNLDAGDKVKLYAFCGSTGTLSSGNNETYFWGYKVG